MAQQRKRRARPKAKRSIEPYEHRGKERLNNPPVGLVTPETDKDTGHKTYAHDPHLDPALQWAGKTEHTSFEVPTVSLHVHERIDPRTIIEATRKRNGNGLPIQGGLFERPEENPPVRSAIEFYQHRHNWTNRLIAGDSLLVMNSLLEKEGMAGKVQMVYIDPPYGIRYGSNFQPFVNRRDVKDGKDEDLAQEPETIKAFRDTWELGIHSYLSYLRDRLLLARELLTESGSCFVQMGDENVHRARLLMDELFGAENFCGLITFRKTVGHTSKLMAGVADFLLWYAKHREHVKFRKMLRRRRPHEISNAYRFVETSDGSLVKLDSKEKGEPVQPLSPTSQTGSENARFGFKFFGETYFPPGARGWSTNLRGMERLRVANRLSVRGGTLLYKRYLRDAESVALSLLWDDTMQSTFAIRNIYAVQTYTKVIQRCLLMTTDPGDLVFDPTCGSGTTAYVAEQWGRRWMTCDTSRVAISLTKQRLMTAVYDYYELAHPTEGVGSGFKYETVPHITLRSIANNPDIKEGMSQKEIDEAIARHAPQETLYDRPKVDKDKKRVTGPFSVEAVPAPMITSIDDTRDAEPPSADDTVSRSGQTLRQCDWRDEMLKTGIRGKAGQFIQFARLEPLPTCRYLHADGETRPNDAGADSVRDGPARASQRIVVSFGPEHAPLEQRQVEQALQEARTLMPKPEVIVFAAFQFDPEAAKDIDETDWPGMTLLKAQMNADLFTEDLKRKRASNQSFWLIGQPDVTIEALSPKEGGGKRVHIHGFDYYNTKTGEVESGATDKIAMWMLDPDYDGRSLYPRQVFFPMSGNNDGWTRLAKNLRAEIDEELIEAYRGTVSLPFDPGEHACIAVKIIDDRGIESLKVVAFKSIEEVAEECFRDVSQEVSNRLPDDLIENMDHYNTGAKKR